MAARVRNLIGKLFGRGQSYKVLIAGLDASGKTSILYKLLLGEIVQTIPTIGFNVETIVHDNTSLTVWDVGGCDKIRPLIRHYLAGTDALIFVIDAGHPERLDEARIGFSYLLSAEESIGLPILIYLNKIDLPNAMKPEHVQEKMRLNELRVPYFVQPCSTQRSEELRKGMTWLINILKSPPPAAARVLPSLHAPTINANEEEALLKWLAIEDEDTAEEYVEKFCSQQSLGNTFDHRSLLRIIWSSLHIFGRRDAVKKIFDNIRCYVPDANETLIYFWIQIVHYARETNKTSTDNFNDFLVLNPRLLNQNELPLNFYSEQVLFSDQAKSAVVLPNLKQLPSIVVQEATTTSIPMPMKKVDDPEETVKELSDDEFLQQFESCTLTSWSHKTHLRMAWLYLTRHGRRDGVKKIFDGIKHFIDHSQVSRKTTFHFTMTYFWIQMVDLAIAKSEKGMTFEEFMHANPHLMNGGLFLEYYKKETMLNNPTARSEFVLPDVKPLPTLVVQDAKKR